jgi:hypothetical protein
MTYKGNAYFSEHEGWISVNAYAADSIGKTQVPKQDGRKTQATEAFRSHQWIRI